MSDTYWEGNAMTMTAAQRRAWQKRWPNFAPTELASWGGELRINERALDGLQAVRTELGKPMHVNSAYRSEAHNRHVGGAPRSQHKAGTAFDIALRGGNDLRKQAYGDRIEALARKHGAKGIGRYNSFIHIDWRSGSRVRTWDQRSEALFVGG